MSYGVIGKNNIILFLIINAKARGGVFRLDQYPPKNPHVMRHEPILNSKIMYPCSGPIDLQTSLLNPQA